MRFICWRVVEGDDDELILLLFFGCGACFRRDCFLVVVVVLIGGVFYVVNMNTKFLIFFQFISFEDVVVSFISRIIIFFISISSRVSLFCILVLFF